jgi:hypothetical protein
MVWAIGRHEIMVALALVVAPSAAYAGPPFVTDDPEPTEYRTFEVFTYSQGTLAGGRMSDTTVGVEVDYGAAPNLQIGASLPVGFSAVSHAASHFGVIEAALGAKYRFIEEQEDGWRPQVSFYPAIQTAITRSGDSDCDSATHEFLPLWTQKSFGPWTTFGGGGYRINPGIDGRNSWFAGWAVLRQITNRLQRGAEIYRETATARGADATAGINVAAIYDINDAFHIVASGGPGTGPHNEAPPISYYLALKWKT